MSKVLIVAEHLHGKLNSSTARCVTCARDMKADGIDILVLADATDAVAAQAAKIDGVSKVLKVANPANAHALAAVYAPQVVAAARNGYSHVLLPSTTFGKDVAPRVAASAAWARNTSRVTAMPRSTVASRRNGTRSVASDISRVCGTAGSQTRPGPRKPQQSDGDERPHSSNAAF